MDLKKYVVDRIKKRLVDRGFSQKEGINSEETLAPGCKVHFLQTIMVLASMMKWDIHHMDVKTNLP